jgi:hypothetical protein
LNFFDSFVVQVARQPVFPRYPIEMKPFVKCLARDIVSKLSKRGLDASVEHPEVSSGRHLVRLAPFRGNIGRERAALALQKLRMPVLTRQPYEPGCIPLPVRPRQIGRLDSRMTPRLILMASAVAWRIVALAGGSFNAEAVFPAS